jgi:hypothetical protein
MKTMAKRYPLYKIVSDGTGPGTRLTNADGTPNPALEEFFSASVRRVSWELAAGKVARITLELMPLEVELTGEVQEVNAEPWEHFKGHDEMAKEMEQMTARVREANRAVQSSFPSIRRTNGRIV